LVRSVGKRGIITSSDRKKKDVEGDFEEARRRYSFSGVEDEGGHAPVGSKNSQRNRRQTKNNLKAPRERGGEHVQLSPRESAGDPILWKGGTKVKVQSQPEGGRKKKGGDDTRVQERLRICFKEKYACTRVLQRLR